MREGRPVSAGAEAVDARDTAGQGCHVRSAFVRHADAIAIVVLVLSIVGAAFGIALQALKHPSGDFQILSNVSQLLAAGTVGAALLYRRPDLSFGWVLAVAAASMVLAIGVATPAGISFELGHGSQLKLWAASLGGLQWIPAVLNGVLYNRFPSGRPSGRFGVLLDRTLLWGTALTSLVVFGSWPTGSAEVGHVRRFIDQTPIPPVLDLLRVNIPLLILLGGISGVSVIVRCLRAEGLERKRMVWVAAAAAINLAGFPIAFAELMPSWLGYALAFLLPLAILVPVLRYNLWAIDSIVRRGATYHLTGGESAVGSMVRGVGEMLKLAYVAVHRGDDVVASYGEPTSHAESWPLLHEGEKVGELVASPRFGYESIGLADREVLASAAGLVAGSVRADGLTTDLLEARHRLVTAREEERRRLRRDLHDGLGPMLTGLGLNLDAARANPQKAGDYLANAKSISTQVITEIRELVYGLRPPMLDDLGLVGALRLHLGQVARESGLTVALEPPYELPLPAALEVAVFRTVIEAVNNVVKHSDAKTVWTRLECDDDLAVTVEDDGAGSGTWTPGVGLTGMRERAEELGGTFEAGWTATGGRIRATFPLEKATL